MGACASNQTFPAHSVSTTLQKDNDRKIEETLRAAQDEEKKVIKCLLLGAGECGKSTILKQMKILHLDGFKSPEEKASYKALIWKNTLESVHTLCSACESLKIPYDNAANKARAEALLRLNVNDSPLDHKADITALWKDGGIQKAVQRASEFHLLDSAPYFLEASERILVSTYEPNTQDILRSRIATTGIIETEFIIDHTLFRMYDVGGQRGERKKWIHCFENVTAIMFIASLSEYDQVLAEDRTRNRLKESLDLFEGIINLPWFKDAPIILFLNKDDLFRKKIETVDIGIYFPQYTGGTEYSLGLKFIQDEYFARNLNEQKTIYCFAEDTELLTSRGFMNVDEVKEALKQDTTRLMDSSESDAIPSPHSAPLLFASFDPATEGLTYQQATHFIEKYVDGDMIEFEQQAQDAVPLKAQSRGISLRVTPEHIMYLRRGKESTEYVKMPAGEIVDELNASSQVQMRTCAPCGFTMSCSAAMQQLQYDLSLVDEEIAEFISVYGRWVAAGAVCTEEAILSAATSSSFTTARVSAWTVYFTAQSTLQSGFWSFVWTLQPAQLRCLFASMHSVTSSPLTPHSSQLLLSHTTTSSLLRDELIRLAVHAGCTASFHSIDETMEWAVEVRSGESEEAQPVLSASHIARMPISSVRGKERVWCVTVPPTNLLIARRATRCPLTPSLVLSASSPVIVGNCHVTDATNTENIAFVWKATKHIILEQNLTRSGLLMC